ncbi:MAG: ATP-dependent helicase [Candidatus Zixiibacteriota bacterium]
MPWDSELLPDQKDAASHVGSHARLLAGPGTGKTLTLTRRISYLVGEQNISPDSIVALTFTRAAARELRQRIGRELGPNSRLPKVSTLHSFALKQLMTNRDRISQLPAPLRISDDWEERNIVLEDLKTLLGLRRVDEGRALLSRLSADWQSLAAEESEWEERFPDARFLGAWREHRSTYGYVLRAELVYQLKHCLAEDPGFVLEGPPLHLLVDEYQDLNRCDLEIVKTMTDRGAELYCAGDDDQSIYAFREALPEGIRRFDRDYQPSTLLSLSTCKRCDPAILELALFVANQDHRRLDKPLHAEPGRDRGEVAILQFSDQTQEARCVAELCRNLLANRGLHPHDILVLLRSDRHGAFSLVLTSALETLGIPSSTTTAETDLLNGSGGRQVLSLIRLAANPADSLAWRSLLMLRQNGLGDVAVSGLYKFAIERGIRFSEAVAMVAHQPSLIARHGTRIRAEWEAVQGIVARITADVPPDGDHFAARLGSLIEEISGEIAGGAEEGLVNATRFLYVLDATEPSNLRDFLAALETSDEPIEQELREGVVNILTMHRAKGLTAKAVFVLGAEDEYIPGQARGAQIGDERRLLYVSMTRAVHHLYITYCNSRTGRQMHTGRTRGRSQRTLTQFLRDSPTSISVGVDVLARLTSS